MSLVVAPLQLSNHAAVGASSISQLGVLFGAFAAAQVAAFELYSIIDRVSTIDPRSEAGEKPPLDRLQGRVEFRNVTFAYPSRPDSPVLRDFSLVVEAGQRIGICGPSGSGESAAAHH